MDRALELARGVLGAASPHPAVGCVVVRDGAIVGEGVTQPNGGDHAERVALAQAGERARGAVMYVTLEPCSHHGRTPPCTDAVIGAGVAEVRAAIQDPNPKVGGQGLARLREAGIRVSVGEGSEEAGRLYEAFFKWITTGVPFVTAKFAMSLDGKIATRTGDSKWITGEEARREAHRLRAISDAVMVGANTVRLDDPRLTARDGSGRPCGRQPLRVVVDGRGTTSPGAAMLGQPGQSLVATTQAVPSEARAQLERAGAEVAVVESASAMVDLGALLRLLGRRDVSSLLVEGGGGLLSSLFEANLIDKVAAFIAPVVVGGGAATTPVEGVGVARIADALRLRDVAVDRFGDDVLITGYVGG